MSLRNPVSIVRLPSFFSGRDSLISSGEEKVLLKGCLGYGGEIHDVVVMAIETAMSRGEIVSLKWENVDLAKRTARFIDTKNGESRTVLLSRAAVSILHIRKKIPRIDGQVVGMTPEAITRVFEQVCLRAGIDDLRFHDLRHEATSRFFEKGLNPMQVAVITGHKTLHDVKALNALESRRSGDPTGYKISPS